MSRLGIKKCESLFQKTARGLLRHLMIRLDANESTTTTRYSTTSKNMSTYWEAHTRSQDDVEAWWRIVAPNDFRKNKRLAEYMKKKGKSK